MTYAVVVIVRHKAKARWSKLHPDVCWRGSPLMSEHFHLLSSYERILHAVCNYILYCYKRKVKPRTIPKSKLILQNILIITSGVVLNSEERNSTNDQFFVTFFMYVGMNYNKVNINSKTKFLYKSRILLNFVLDKKGRNSRAN